MPIQKVNKRDIINAAFQVFNKRGYHFTSMSDIADACGLLKGSIYHYFSGKEDLMQEVLKSSKAYGSLGKIPILYDESIPPKQRMERFLGSINDRDLIDGGGCLMGNTGLEMSAISEEIRKNVKQFFDEWVEAVAKLFVTRTSEERAIQLAEQSLQELEGAIMLSKVNNDTTYLADAKKRIISKL